MTLDEAIRNNKEFLKELITKFEKELNKNDFETIYKDISLRHDYIFTTSFTALLLKNNINPLEYMNEVPNSFAKALDIEKFIIPANVTSIGYWAFEDCVNLSSIEIPKSITIIGGSAFHNCPKLKDVYYTGSEEDWKNIKIEDDNDELLKANIHYNS